MALIGHGALDQVISQSSGDPRGDKRPGCHLMQAARQAKRTLFHPHHVRFIAPLRRIPESAEVLYISRILSSCVYTYPSSGPSEPNQPVPYVCFHFLLLPICDCKAMLMVFPPSANDPSPEQYVNNCSQVDVSSSVMEASAFPT